jgi:hypothetical protein
VAPDVGHFDVPELAQAMKLEWSDEALADLDRFVEFLNQQQPSLAPLVAKENCRQGASTIRPPAVGKADYRSQRISSDRITGSRRSLCVSISLRWQTSCNVAGLSCTRSTGLRSRPATLKSVASSTEEKEGLRCGLSICRPRAPHLVVPAQYSLTRRRPVEPVFQSANEVRCAKRTPRRTGCLAFAGHDEPNVLKRF